MENSFLLLDHLFSAVVTATVLIVLMSDYTSSVTICCLCNHCITAAELRVVVVTALFVLSDTASA